MRKFAQFLGNERGTIAVMTALSAPVLFGFGALAVDLAHWQVSMRSMQGAADAAAYSAGIAQKAADGRTVLTEGRSAAAAQGFVDGVDGVVVQSINRLPRVNTQPTLQPSKSSFSNSSPLSSLPL